MLLLTDSLRMQISRRDNANIGRKGEVYILPGIIIILAFRQCVAWSSTLIPLKGTQVPSGKYCQADARRRFGYIYIRLGNRVRDLQPRSIFRSFRKIDAKKQESRASLPFFCLFWAQQLTTPHGNDIFGQQAFRVRVEKSYIIRLVNSKLVVKAVFSSMM